MKLGALLSPKSKGRDGPAGGVGQAQVVMWCQELSKGGSEFAGV